MGNYVSYYVQSTLDAFSSYWITPCRVLVIGLDGAGKTTLLYMLKLGEVVTTIPTIGFNVESFSYKNIEFTAWDIGGQSRIRALWHCYAQNTDAVIFVVDAADRDRITEAAEELARLFKFEELKNAKLLVYANKQDQPDCMSVEEIGESLKIDKVTSNPHRVEPMVATAGDGIYEGIEWLCKAVSGTL